MINKKLIIVAFNFILLTSNVENHEVRYMDAFNIAEIWAKAIGENLWNVSEAVTRRNKVIDSFASTYVAVENGSKILEDVSDTLKMMMDDKVKAVENIMNHAETLSLRRKPEIFPNSTFDYFDSNNVSDTEVNEALAQKTQLYEYFEKREQLWDWEQQNGPNLKVPYIERKLGAYRYMPLVDHAHFKTQVNINFSSVRVAINLYSREKNKLNDIRWSEALDTTFKNNFRKYQSLTWQYFASADGFIRLYPAIKWSEERYDQTYDYRIRSWFTDAITSPKDVVILVDRSGSMKGNRRVISRHIVNEVLDTLNDNDFINIYTFGSNATPLVDCFGDNLVQANEENLRLLRESLAVYRVEHPGNMSFGLHKAFQLLQRYREGKGGGAQCNQAIMLITEGLDYDYQENIFKLYNRPEKYYRPVRVFTYQLGSEPSDGVPMEWIACANMGYYVNMTVVQDVHEKVFRYVPVMSRPLNMNQEKPEPLWSALYVDLADRKLSNWLWNKFEGNRQRDTFVNFAKEEYTRMKLIFKDNTHFVQQVTHEYEKYKIPREYTYLTTVSLPVFDHRPNSTRVLGVAAVDVSKDYIKSLITCYRLGANGYAFILTNNGYLLLHPDHRPVFQNILKPTFNRVDMTEVEILDDSNEPRLFGKSIVELRKNIVTQKEGYQKLRVKSHMDHMRRISLGVRHYYYTKLGGPFSIVLALPDKYGLNTVRHIPNHELFQKNLKATLTRIMESEFWKIHPEWLYCKYYGMQKKFYSLEEELLYYLRRIDLKNFDKAKQCDNKLVNSLIQDFYVTDWFDDNLQNNKKVTDYIEKFKITLIFMATHSGLTRWQETRFSGNKEKEFIKANNKAIDETWYRRAVDLNYHEEKFVYSVPFREYLDYNVSDVLVTASLTVFKEDESKKAPAATIAYQFYQESLYKLYLSVISNIGVYQCGNQKCHLTCGKDIYCYLVDDNGFVVVSNEADDVGKFLANINVDVITDVVDNLVSDGIYKRTRFFDYQAICYYSPKKESRGPRINSFLSNFLEFAQWIAATIVCLFRCVFGEREYLNFTEKTELYEGIAIAKTVPTPCDTEMWLYHVDYKSNTFTQQQQQQQQRHQQHNKTLGCSWSYIAHNIPGSNLIFLVVNEHCKKQDVSNNYKYTPKPVEIFYNVSLPCYIATQNNFTRKNYIKCFKRSDKEDTLNLDKRYCADYEENEKLRLRTTY